MVTTFMAGLVRISLLSLMILSILFTPFSFGKVKTENPIIYQGQINENEGKSFPISISVAKALTGYDRLPNKWLRNISISIVGDGLNLWNNVGNVVDVNMVNSTIDSEGNLVTYTDLILSMYSSYEIDILNHTSISVYEVRETYHNVNNTLILETLKSIEKTDIVLLLSPISPFNLGILEGEITRLVSEGTLVISPFGNYGFDLDLVNPLSFFPEILRVGVVTKSSPEYIDPYSPLQYTLHPLQSRSNYETNARADIAVPFLDSKEFYDGFFDQLQNATLPDGLETSFDIPCAFLAAGLVQVLGKSIRSNISPFELKNGILQTSISWESSDKNNFAGRGIINFSELFETLKKSAVKSLINIEPFIFPYRSPTKSVGNLTSSSYLWLGEEFRYHLTYSVFEPDNDLFQIQYLDVHISPLGNHVDLRVPTFSGILVLEVTITDVPEQPGRFDIEISLQNNIDVLSQSFSISIVVPKFQIGMVRHLENDTSIMLQDTASGIYHSFETYLAYQGIALYSIYEEPNVHTLEKFQSLIIIDPELNSSMTFENAVYEFIKSGKSVLFGGEDFEGFFGQTNSSVFHPQFIPFSWFSPLNLTLIDPMFNFGFEIFGNKSFYDNRDNIISYVQDISFMSFPERNNTFHGDNATFPFLSDTPKAFNVSVDFPTLLVKNPVSNNLSNAYFIRIGNGKLIHISSSYMLLDLLQEFNIALGLPEHATIDFLLHALGYLPNEGEIFAYAVQFPLFVQIRLRASETIQYLLQITDGERKITPVGKKEHFMIVPLPLDLKDRMKTELYLIFANGNVEQIVIDTELFLPGLIQWFLISFLIGLFISLIPRKLKVKRKISSHKQKTCNSCTFIVSADEITCKWCGHES